MDIQFTRAHVEDAEKLLEVQKASFQESFLLYKDYGVNPLFENRERILYKIQNHYYYKIIVDGVIVGAMNIYKKTENHYCLNRIFVHPDYENMGIGRKAMAFLDDEKSFADALVWTLDTPHKSYKNHRFYESLGYVKTGEVEEITEKLKLIYYKREVKK